MSPETILTLGDFDPQAPPANLWLFRNTIDSPLGPFVVELAAPPDSELIVIANEMVAHLAKEHETILNTVYGLYERASENKRWMKDHDVPCQLEKDQIAQYISRRAISVRRNHSGHPMGMISMRAKWDREHLIAFGSRNGRLVSESL